LSRYISFDTFDGEPGVYILATFAPLEGGEKIGTFGSLGKKIDPSEKKNSIVKKKFEFYKQMFFSITIATLLRNT